MHPRTADAEAYRRDGYVLKKAFVRPEEVSAIRDEAKDVFIAQMRRLAIADNSALSEAQFEAGMYRLFAADLKSFINCGLQVQHLISLHRLALDQRIVGELKNLGLAHPNVCARPLMHFNSPKLATKEVYWRLALHQDWRTMQGSLDSAVVWIPMVDIDRSLGTLEVVAGSHRSGLLDCEWKDGYGNIKPSPFDNDAMAIEVRLGDALFFSALLAHRSGTNSTNSIRWSCHFRYNNLAEATFVERGFPHPYTYRPQEALITEDFPRPSDMARMLGDED